jgi:two-component system, LytTR family, sensor kinase
VSELLNLVGLSTGVVLYAMLLAMVVRAGHGSSVQARFDPLLLATSVLGLLWNLCALPAYGLPKVGIPGPFPFLIAAGFSALGFLPAVVVHSVLRGERDGIRGGVRRSIAIVAYAVSASAAALHVWSAWTAGTIPSPLGMRLLTYTFVALVVPLFGVTRGQPGARRALWAAALAIFAVSGLHLSQIHRGDASWPVELLGHHASLPLAFAILYQDYPFALADLFLKRALALVSLVTLAFLAIVSFGAWSASFQRYVEIDPRQVGVLVTLWVATALLYPFLRRTTAWFVDAVVLWRPDYKSLAADIARGIQEQDEIDDLLDEVCARLTPALSATAVWWTDIAYRRSDLAGGVVATGARALAVLSGGDGEADGSQAAAAAVLVPVAEPPRYALAVGPLKGGRRLLSDDVATLEAIAVAVGRRIDAIRITRERVERETREQEMTKLAAQAELRALRAQINPHFLFNALTTIGYLIQTVPDRALETLMRLTALLRGVLRSEGEYTTLGRELDLVEAYLEIERARFDERLRVQIDVPQNLRDTRIPILVLQPVVENAVKHGVAPRRLGGQVTVRGRLERDGRDTATLVLIVHDTGGASDASLKRGRETGVGLHNVERRLAGHYGDRASLSLESDPDRGTTVEIRVPVEPAAASAAEEARWTTV